MAADASADAQFPVYLALIKLAVDFLVDWLGKVFKYLSYLHILIFEQFNNLLQYLCEMNWIKMYFFRLYLTNKFYV